MVHKLQQDGSNKCSVSRRVEVSGQLDVVRRARGSQASNEQCLEKHEHVHWMFAVFHLWKRYESSRACVTDESITCSYGAICTAIWKAAILQY